MKVTNLLHRLRRKKRQRTLSFTNAQWLGDSAIHRPAIPNSNTPILGLPDRLILLILFHDLTTKDLLALSHTCQKLRSFSSIRPLWAAAIGSEAPIPKLPIYPLLSAGMKALLPVSPQTLAILDKPLNAGMTVFPAISSPLPSSRDHSHPREVYLAAQRQKRQLSQPSGPIIVHPRILALEECHYNKFRTFCLNPAGDILAILMDDEIIVLDFVGNHKYSIKIWPIGRNIISKCCPSQFDPFSVERFQFQVEGALLVFMLSGEEIGLLFLPFRLDNCDSILLGAIPVNQRSHMLSFRISGTHLIVAEKSSAWGMLRLYDLVNGEVEEFKTAQNTPPTAAEVYHDEVLVYSDESPTSRRRALHVHFLKRRAGSNTIMLGSSDRILDLYLPPAALIDTSHGRKMTAWASKKGSIDTFPINFTFAPDGFPHASEPSASSTTLSTDNISTQSSSKAESTSYERFCQALPAVFRGFTPQSSVIESVSSGKYVLSLVFFGRTPHGTMVMSKQCDDGDISHRPVYLLREGEINPRHLEWGPQEYQRVRYSWSDRAGRIVVLHRCPDQTMLSFEVYDL